LPLILVNPEDEDEDIEIIKQESSISKPLANTSSS
jgi:hypothetical protein